MIPREFFIFETNAVLPVNQFPPTQYHSRFSPCKSLWETVVFPALSPQTRQQVLFLQQALAKMRAAFVASDDQKASGHHHWDELRMKQVIAYTQEEFRVYSLCFHELIRQIKCICREQSELLFEIRQHYDAALSRLLEQINQLQCLVDKQQQQIGDLVSQHDQALRSNDALLEQALRDQSIQEKALLRGESRRQRRRRRCCECQKECCDEDANSSDEDEDDEDNSDDDCDDEELAWRRQRRRNCVQLDALHRSVSEENVAAARLQSAYHRYHLRKEQHRLALREERNIAALDIQRSYRGFRQRQLALHRRAVVQVILKRRKEAAAIELLQANVRSYLLKQKKEESKKLKRSAAAASKALSANSTSSDASASVSVLSDQPGATSESHEIGQDSRAEGDASAILMSLLSKVSELTIAISELQARDNSSSSHHATSSHRSSEHGAPMLADRLHPEVPSNTQFERKQDGEIEEKLQQAEELVRLFHAAVASLRNASSSHKPESSPDGENTSQAASSKSERRSSAAAGAELTMAQSTSTSSLDLHFLPFDVFADLNEQETISRNHEVSVSNSKDSVVSIPVTIAADARRRLSTIASPQHPVSSTSAAQSDHQHGETQHNGDFNLDESLWNAELSAIQLSENEVTQLRNAELLSELLSSRDIKKKFVWLKQFISDTYDTVMGKLRELPLWALQRFVKARCSLAMSLDEWQDNHGHQRMSIHGNEDPIIASLASLRLVDLIRDHFRCQSGLKNLVDSALDNLHTCLDNFKVIDPDVHRFHAFLNMERSHDELLFFCVCRHLASQGIDMGSLADRRQPVFHPETMREVIELPQALRIAKTLFRVDDEASIRNADAGAIEVENAVYRRYQPSSAFSQFEAVLSGYYLTVEHAMHGMRPSDDCEDSGETADSGNKALDWTPQSSHSVMRRPVMGASPLSLVGLPPGSMARPSNVNQFHAKQFHGVAPRSPLVRRQYYNQQHTPGSASSARWVHFDDLVDLLLKYRLKMSHFHLFVRWARELYASTVTADGSVSAFDPETAPLQLLSDAQFADALVVYSLGPTERELTNIFHNALKQRSLQQWMPPRVFASVVLLMLRNGLLSVSNFCPQGTISSNARGAGSLSNRNQSVRAQNENKRWMRLALKWRSHEVEFEKALEAIYESPVTGEGGCDDQATKLLELRNELYKLFISSSGMDNLQRAEGLYELICMELSQAKAPGSIDISGVYQDDKGGDDRGDLRQVGGLEAGVYNDLDRTSQGSGETGDEGSAWETDSTA